MKIHEILEGTNPTVTPKSSDMVMGQQTQTPTPPKPPIPDNSSPTKDKEISGVVSNFQKGMIDKMTAQKQLKAHGVNDNELDSKLNPQAS